MSKTINDQASQAIAARRALFSELSPEEISKRKAIDLDQQDVFLMILDVLINYPDKPYFDFRYYKSVDLGLGILTSVPDKYLRHYLLRSEYNQHIFGLINIGDEYISVRKGINSTLSLPESTTPIAPGLKGRELIFNFSDVEQGGVTGNFKFSSGSSLSGSDNLRISFLMDRTKIMGDFREAHDYRNLNNLLYYIKTFGDRSMMDNWQMLVFSCDDAIFYKTGDGEEYRSPKFTGVDIGLASSVRAKVVDGPMNANRKIQDSTGILIPESTYVRQAVESGQSPTFVPTDSPKQCRYQWHSLIRPRKREVIIPYIPLASKNSGEVDDPIVVVAVTTAPLP